MKRFLLLLCAILSVHQVSAQPDGFRWRTVPMDGSRTGVTTPNASNVPQALGTFDGSVYVSPNGSFFASGTATAKAAALMLTAQPQMAFAKEVVGHSEKGMRRGRPESQLSDWVADILMAKTAELTGKKVDISIINHGGIRIDMPAGDVLMDDVMSMFPFENYLTYITMKGSDVRTLFEGMAGSVQGVGGVKVTVKNGELVELLVAGAPVEDEKVYGIASIDFLLNGGDGFHLAKDALSLDKTDFKVFDAILAYIRELMASGRSIDFETDGRVTDKSERKRL